jgi:hypothetical protein
MASRREERVGEGPRVAGVDRAGTTDLDRCARWALALLSLGAAGIHFAAAAQHVDQAWYQATASGVVAWLQVASAVAVLVRPSRRLLLGIAMGNAAVIGGWVMSWTVGLPLGHDAGEAEPVAFMDAVATTFEGLVLAGSLTLLAPRVGLGRLPAGPGLVAVSAVGVVVAASSILAITPGVTGEDHGHGAVAIAADGTSLCERSDFGGSAGGHGHRGPVAYQPLHPDQRRRYAAQVAGSDRAVASFPTVRAARAGGYVEITPYTPCVASHFLSRSAFRDGTFDPSKPEILLFAGTDPDSHILGLSYLLRGDPGQPPQGFTGENDQWHRHTSFCVRDGEIIDGDDTLNPEDCAATSGAALPTHDVWMLHMWNVPGWESRWGLFSSEHPDLGGERGDPGPAFPDG